MCLKGHVSRMIGVLYKCTRYFKQITLLTTMLFFLPISKLLYVCLYRNVFCFIKSQTIKFEDIDCVFCTIAFIELSSPINS